MIELRHSLFNHGLLLMHVWFITYLAHSPCFSPYLFILDHLTILARESRSVELVVAAVSPQPHYHHPLSIVVHLYHSVLSFLRQRPMSFLLMMPSLLQRYCTLANVVIGTCCTHVPITPLLNQFLHLCYVI